MQTLGELKLLPVWADAQHLAQSARLLMEGHELKVLPVLDAGTVVGLAHLQDVINTSLDVRVSAVMKGAPTALEANMTVIKAAQLFVERELDYAPVMREGQLVGMLTTHHLLRELRRTWDPLTSLGWSDRLREWGAEKLRTGQEISILFIDIDQFGQYNKKHGHIVGDKVLIQFAKMLSNAVDPAQEILVRYGGDEFAIGTLRDHAGTMELAREIRNGGAALMLEEEGRPIGFTMGVSGGREEQDDAAGDEVAVLVGEAPDGDPGAERLQQHATRRRAQDAARAALQGDAAHHARGDRAELVADRRVGLRHAHPG